MIFILMFAAVFGTSDFKETYTADIKLTTTNNVQYCFKRVYEDRMKVHNEYPTYFTEHDKRICESLSELDKIDSNLEDNEDFEDGYPEES